MGSPESTRSGEVAAEVSRRLGRHGWSKRRSSTNGVGHIDGNGKIYGKAKERGSRSSSLGSGPCKGLRACQPSCGLDLGDVLQLPKEDLAGAVRLFRAPEACAVRKMCGGAAHDHHGSFARVQVELLASTHCFAGCVEREVTKIYPSLKLRGFVDDITALVKGRNKEVAEMAKKK